MKKTVLVVFCLLLASTCLANTEPGYNYPIENPYEATVAGTPMQYMAPVPQDIKVEKHSLTVFEDREIPEILWKTPRTSIPGRASTGTSTSSTPNSTITCIFPW